MKKGYWTGGDYWGWIPWEKRYMRFENDTQYREYLEAHAS